MKCSCKNITSDDGLHYPACSLYLSSATERATDSKICADEGTPTGREESIHGFQTYVTEPSAGIAPKGIVVIIPDAFGWKLVNNRILADQYAKRIGVIVYLPDFMNGRPIWVNGEGMMVMTCLIGYYLKHDLLQSMDTVMHKKQSVFSKMWNLVLESLGLIIPLILGSLH